MQQDDRGDAFYLVESGMTSVSIDGSFIREMGPGSHFGELALIRHGALRTATVIAVSSPTVVLKVTERMFEKKIKPNLARFTNKIGKAGGDGEPDPQELGEILAKMLMHRGGDGGKALKASRDPDGAAYDETRGGLHSLETMSFALQFAMVLSIVGGFCLGVLLISLILGWQPWNSW